MFFFLQSSSSSSSLNLGGLRERWTSWVLFITERTRYVGRGILHLLCNNKRNSNYNVLYGAAKVQHVCFPFLQALSYTILSHLLLSLFIVPHVTPHLLLSMLCRTS